MSQRSNRVNLRLTDLEKADWTKAAGGTRKLSEWIRGTCNAAATAARTESAEAGHTQPSIVKDFIVHADDVVVPRLDAPSDAASVEQSKPRVVMSGQRIEGKGPRAKTPGPECSRSRHHRSGVYCGACKTVVK